MKTEAEDLNGTTEEYYNDKGFRRKLRAHYRKLATNIEENAEQAVNPESKLLQDYINDAEKLFSSVRHPREAISDSNVLVALAKKGREQAQLLKADIVSFDNSTFAEKIITYVNGRRAFKEEDDDAEQSLNLSKTCWKKLGRKSCQLFRKTPKLDCLLGPLVIELPQSVKTVRKPMQKRVVEGEAVKLKEIDTVEQQEEATTKEVERLYQILKKETNGGTKSICFFRFVINPDSFGQTIENIFHLAFLIKDVRVIVELDEDDLPVLNLYKGSNEREENEVALRKQVVVPFTMTEWTQLIELYDIKKGMIPTRKKIL